MIRAIRNRAVFAVASWLLTLQDERRLYVWGHPEMRRKIGDDRAAFLAAHDGKSICWDPEHCEFHRPTTT